MPRIVVGILMTLVVALQVPGVAHAGGGWDKSFGPEALAAWVGGDQARMVVVLAGQIDEPYRVAQRALIDGLRRSGRVKLVMDDASLSRVYLLADAEIVRSARLLPVNEIVVLRVFPGSPGTPANAVVTFYSPKGELRTALAAQEGVPLMPRSGTTIGQGVSPDAATTVDRVLHEPERFVPDAGANEKSAPLTPQQLYDRDFIGVLEHDGDPSLEDFYRGRARKSIQEEQLLRAVGGPELVASLHRRRPIKNGLIAGGLVVAGIGLATGTGFFVESNAKSRCYGFDNRDCRWQPDIDLLRTAAVGAAVGGIVAGLGLIIAGGAVSRHPVSGRTAKKLVDRYNGTLRRKHGLPAADDAPPDSNEEGRIECPTGAGAIATITPVFMPGGGGIAIGGDF